MAERATAGATRPTIDWPEAELAGGTAMTMPEVSFGQVTSAGFASEAVETDYWQLTERTRRRYRGEALAKAEELIGGAFDAVPFDRPRSYDPATGYGALEAWDHSTQARQREDLMLRLAKRKHPEEFADLPATDDEIDAAVTAELMAQYQDAQEVLAAAPESFFGATVPEFLGRAGTASTDEVGLPLAIASLGIGEMANVGRVILTEAGLSVLGEAATLPAQARMAERLGIEPPDPAVQLAFAAVIGGAVPAGIYGATRGLEFGAGRLAGLSNREVVQRLSRVPLTPAQRAAVQRIDTAAAEAEVGPQARPSDGPGAVDGAIEDMSEPGVPPDDGPPTDTGRAIDLTTPPKASEPEVLPDLPEPNAAAPDRPATAQLATPGSGRVTPSLEANLTNLIVGAEAGGGGYDAFSDFSVIFPPKAITSMTLDEIDAWQTANIEAGAASSAVGGPQFIRSTLREVRERAGFTGAELFTPELQQRLALELMRDAGLEDYRAGTLSADDFADNLAGVWAGLPLASGRSAYAGDGLNSATIDRATVMAVIGGQEYQTAARANPGLRRVPLAGLQVDARTYQFRTEVNEAGVGIGLDRVSLWDDMLAGDFLVHERLDGSRYVADGHHRTDLGQRLMREGHAPIDVNAYIFREADGFTVEEVRARAAIKNIEAGSASAVDAAKVLRVDPAMIQQLSLRQAQVRDARGLMQLGDEAFDMVTAGVIREDFAAVVGEMTRDATMQSAILRALIQGKPANQAEARQMAADAYRSGLARRDADAQGSLFGDEFDVAETLFRERAKVMAAALAKLRKDRSVFNTLVKEAGRIREAGNALTDESNLARIGTDEQALAIIERLANRAGPVDDALNSAAQTARSGRISDGVEQFLGVVRGAIEGGDLARLIDGPPRSRADGDAPEAGAPEGAGGPDAEVAAGEPGQVEEFDDTAAIGDMFGGPPTAELEPEARIGDARAVADREAQASVASWYLAQSLTPAAQRTLAQYRDSQVGDLVAELDGIARIADRHMARNPGDPTGEELRSRAVEHAETLLTAARENRSGDVRWPRREEDTGEWDYEDPDVPDEVMAVVEFLDEVPARGLPIDEIDPEAGGDYRFAEVDRMPPEKVFPPPQATRNIDTESKATLPLEAAEARVAEWKAQARADAEAGANRNKVVISLFDYTGAWSQPWVDAGYQVLRYDIKSGTDLILSDFPWNRIEELRQSGFEIHGVLSACPCTTFAGSGARWWSELHDVESVDAVRKVFGEAGVASGAKSPREYNLMLLEATRDVIAQAAPTGFHVLENPIGRIREVGGMPEPTARFHPSDFGNPYTKRTQLFGDFNPDLPTAKVDPSEGSKMQSKLRGDNPQHKEARSTTPEGFAYSFFMANRDDPAREVVDARATTPTEPVTPDEDLRGPSIPPGTEGMVSIGDTPEGELFERPDGRRALRTDDGAVTLEPEGERQERFLVAEEREDLAAQERERARQARRSERTAAGEQTLIEGVAPVTDRQRAEAAQDRPMRGARADAPMDEGLFDSGARAQMDLLEAARQPETPAMAGLWDDPDGPEVEAQIAVLEDELAPVIAGQEDFDVETGVERIDERGEAVAETMRATDMIADLDADTEFLGALDVCKP